MLLVAARRIGATHVFAALLVSAILFKGVLTGWIGTSPVLQTAATVFAAVFVQAAPFLLLGVAVSGALAAFVSPDMLRRVLPRNETAAVTVAGLAGAALPGCECGSMPVARRLFDQGVPASAAIAFLLAAPAINPVVLVATAVAFPGEPAMVAARCTGSLATALITGWLWSRFGKPAWIGLSTDLHDHAGQTRWQTFAETARHDLLQSASFLVLGAAFAAALHVLVPASLYESVSGSLVVSILVMALLAVVLALCSEADAFVASSLSMLPLLPRVVFLVVGPAVDLKLIAMQAGIFGRAFTVRFAPLVFVVAVICGTIAGYLCLGGVR